MVKFGKDLRQRAITEWKDSYFNYKKMKKLLKQIGSQLPKKQMLIKESKDSESSIHSGNDISESFANQIEIEFKRVYLFFVSMEKDLYVKINSTLYQKATFSELSIDAIYQKMCDLCLIIFMAVCLNRFINTNVTAITKILKKFDKKYQLKFGLISLSYFKAQLENKNTDFDYFLQFKVIDETSVIVENLVLEFQDIVERQFNNESEYVNKINDKVKEINKYIALIDDEDFFRIKYQEWLYYIRKGDKVIKNNPSLFQNDIYNPMLSSFLVEDTILLKLLSGNSKQAFISNQTKLSFYNKFNIVLYFAFSFFFNACNTSIIPSMLNLFESNNQSEYYGFIWSIVPLFSFVSLFLFELFGYNHYKTSFILSLILLALGNLLYAVQNNIIWMIIGRCLIGLSANQITIRKYITHFISKESLSNISMLYVFVSISGFAFGPLLSFIGLYLPRTEVNTYIQFNNYTYPGWIAFSISLVLLGLVSVFFTTPLNSNFQMITQIKGIDFKGDKIANSIMQQKEAPLISETEKEMIIHTDVCLEEYNQKSFFNDLNKIPGEINHIILNQSNCHSFLFRSFATIFIFLFTVSLNSELIVLLMSMEFGNKSENEKLVYYLLFIIGLIIPVVTAWFLMKKVMKSYPTGIQISIFFFSELVMTIGFYLSYLNNINYLSVPFFILNLTMNMIIQMITSNLFGNNFPPQWKIMKINIGILLTLGLFAGKIIAGIMIGLLVLLSSHNNNYLYISLGIIGVLIFLCSILSYYNRSLFRNKAITRILRNNQLDKFNMQ